MKADSELGVYSIKAVAEFTGIPASTLRYWEKSYGVVVPKRTDGLHRLYSQRDVERLKWLKRKTEDEGLKASVAHDLLRRELGKISAIETKAGALGAVMILVAEKDPITAELEEYFLNEAGYAVHMVFDGQKAIAQATKMRPDLIILDVILPGMNGLKVCSALKSNPETADIPVLVFSVLDVEQRALDAGADAFLLKPIEQALLIKAVNQLLAQHVAEGGS